MKEEKVARPDVLSYEQGRQDERAEIQAGAVSVAGLIEKARAEERVKIRAEIEKVENPYPKYLFAHSVRDIRWMAIEEFRQAILKALES